MPISKLTPFYLLPLLVEQPTWGGEYICGFKNIVEPTVATKKIGQAYELYKDSLITDDRSTDKMPFTFATATSIDQPQFFHKPASVQTLQSLIDQDPVAVLGQLAVDKYGAEMQVLIKFTQAQNNSYQVHFRPGTEFGKWLAKPESWYFLEKGKATLGLKDVGNVAAYQARCVEINEKAQEISGKVMSGSMSVDNGRRALQDFIAQNHPSQFVNTVFIEKNQIVDLSAGGVHHSWEMGTEIPDGNIVYEVQKNVMDEFCTLRAFDQGNIKDDGKVRPLTIDEYFQALDVTAEKNVPAKYLAAPAEKTDNGATITTLFDNQFYKTTSIAFSGEYAGAETNLNDSFHHVFVQEGSVEVVVGKDGGDAEVWPLQKGWSLFIPAGVEKYEMRSVGTERSVVLKTEIC